MKDLAILLLFCSTLILFSCDEGPLGNDEDDMTEEEYLANCHRTIEDSPEVKEFYQSGDDPLYNSRNNGSSSLMVRKRENVWRVVIRPILQVNPEVFPFPEYLSSYSDTLFFDTYNLLVDNSDPENEYWMVDISFPATNLDISYEVFYECEDGQLSNPAIINLQTPDICLIHPLWRINYQLAGESGNIYSDQKTLDWKVSFQPDNGGGSYSMAFIPFDKISSRAYISSGAYSYIYEDFLEAFRVPDYPEQSSTLPDYINEISLLIDLHELTGISQEQWMTWQESVTIEGELQICDEDFLPSTSAPNARFLITVWNP